MVRRHRRAYRIAPLAAAPAKDRLVGSLCRLNSIWRTSRGSPGRRSVLLAGRPVRHSSLLMCRSSERSAAGFVARATHRRQTTAAFANARSEAVVHSGGVGRFPRPTVRRGASLNAGPLKQRRRRDGARRSGPRVAAVAPPSSGTLLPPARRPARKMVPAAVGEWLGIRGDGHRRLSTVNAIANR